MPINPSIPLAVEPPPYLRMPDPWAAQARAFALRELVRNDELERLKLEELRRKQAEEEAIRDIFRRHITPEGTLNRQGALADLYRLNPETAINVQKNWLAQQKALSEAEESRLKADAARAGRLGSLAGSAVDQPSWERAISQALEEGLITTDQAAKLPRQWDASTQAMVRQFQEQALTAQQQIDAALKRAQEERAKAEHAARLPGYEAESASKQFRLAGQLAPGAAQTPSQWNALRSVLPERLRNLFPTVPYTGAVEQAERLGMTAEERKAAQDRAATRQETERHNRAVEQQRAERDAARRSDRQEEQARREQQSRTERLRALKAEEQRLEREQAPLDEKRLKLGDILRTGKHIKTRPGKKSKSVDITPEERARYQAEFDAASERWQGILDRKKQIADERRQLLGGEAGSSAPGAVATPSGKPRQVDASTGRTAGTPAYTEEQFRQRARERGLTPEQIEQALAKARRQGLVQ
jgi:hypothetical protein